VSEEPDLDDFDDTDECPECSGEGGYAMCAEDCCPHIYGEEGCDDPVCWRRCSVCKGRGYVGA
jgi:hypothetical protein